MMVVEEVDLVVIMVDMEEEEGGVMAEVEVVGSEEEEEEMVVVEEVVGEGEDVKCLIDDREFLSTLWTWTLTLEGLGYITESEGRAASL